MERPKNAPYPKIYSEFEGKIERNGVKRTFWIQDLTEEYIEEAVEAFTREFLNDEPICKYSKIPEDPEAVEECRLLWTALFQQKMSLICLTKDESGATKVAGINCLHVVSKDDADIQVANPKNVKIRALMYFLLRIKNPFEELQVNEYLDAMGLLVLKEFRGEGLGQQILSMRGSVGKLFGIKASVTSFSSFISQKQARRNGFQQMTSIPYEDLPEDLHIPDISEHTKDYILMYKMF